MNARVRTLFEAVSPVRGLLITLVLAACGDSTAPDDPGGPGGSGSGAGARVVITPGALLLTASGETMQLTATVFDAAGQPVQAPVTWQSSNPSTVSVSNDGLATAGAGRGSAQITAMAQGIRSQPALAFVASPAAGVVLIPDSMIVTDPVAVDPAAEYGPGWRYRIRLQGINLAVGQLVIGTGERSLAGRVVSATAGETETELTIELVPLNQLFADLRIDETIPLTPMASETGESRMRAPLGQSRARLVDFTLGRFTCSASGEVPELSLPDPSLDIDSRLALALGYANGLDKYAVIGTITADFSYKPVFKAVFEGNARCETVLATATVPLLGPLALFFGIQVPLGVGFEMDGKLELAEVGFDVSAHAQATAELGLLCPAAGGTCTGVTSLDLPEPEFDFELIAPSLTEQFKVELGALAFLFARPSFGTRFSAGTQFAFLDASAGMKQSIDLATPTRQVKETDYASGFALQGLVDVGPGKDLTAAIERLEALLGTSLDVDLTLVAIADTLARSPRGTFTITPATVAPGNDQTLGDMATFTIDLDPVTYLGIQSVDKVEFYWKKDDGNGGFTLDPGRPGCTSIAASAGQKTFECQTDFLEAHDGQQIFYAFVHAKLFGIPVPIPFEITDDAMAVVNVGAPAAGGVVPILNESYSDASTAEYVVSHADPGDFSGFNATVSADQAVYGTASVTSTQATVFHPGATPGKTTMIESKASESVSIIPDEQERTAGGKGNNVLSLTFEVTGQPIAFTFQGNFTTPSDSRHRGNYQVHLSNVDLPSADTGLNESGAANASIVREGTLQPGRYRIHVFQLAEALSRTDGAAVSSWDVRLAFRSE